jgi:EamA domain-containing membrane protein RarD
MSTTAQTRASGVLFALSAGILWGFVPVYIHFLAFWLSHVAAATQHGIAGFLQ